MLELFKDSFHTSFWGLVAHLEGNIFSKQQVLYAIYQDVQEFFFCKA